MSEQLFLDCFSGVSGVLEKIIEPYRSRYLAYVFAMIVDNGSQGAMKLKGVRDKSQVSNLVIFSLQISCIFCNQKN